MAGHAQPHWDDSDETAGLSEIITPAAVTKHAGCDAMAAAQAPLFGHDLAVYPPVVMKQLAAMRKYDLSSQLGELAGRPIHILSDEPNFHGRESFG